MRGDPKAASVYYDDDITYTGSPGSVNNPMIIEDFWDLIESTPTGLKSINDLEYFNYRRYCKFVNDIDFNDYPEITDGFMDNNFPLLDGGTTKYGYFIRFTDIDGNGCTIRNVCMLNYDKTGQEALETAATNNMIIAGDLEIPDQMLKQSFLTLLVKRGSIFGTQGSPAEHLMCNVKNINISNLIMHLCRDALDLKCDGFFGVTSYDFRSLNNGVTIYSDTVGIKYNSCNFAVYINGFSSFRSIFRGDYRGTPSGYGTLYYDKDPVTLIRCTVNIKGILYNYNNPSNTDLYSNRQFFRNHLIRIMYCHLNYNILNSIRIYAPVASTPMLFADCSNYNAMQYKQCAFNYITGNIPIDYNNTSDTNIIFYITQTSSTAVNKLKMDNCYINLNIILIGIYNYSQPTIRTEVLNAINVNTSNASTCFINISKIKYNMIINSTRTIIEAKDLPKTSLADQAIAKMYLLEESQCKDPAYLHSIGFLVIPAD